jgi:RNA polymerase sigma factor (sigma-70 family)
MRHGSAAFKRDALYTATSRSPGFKKGIDDGDNEGVGDGFLEDGDGHINPELAQRIFRWEQDHQINVNVRSQFSTRDGLRWVKELVSKMATSTSSKSDLIQEGVVELMQAMTSYEHEAPLTETFEAFAKKRIRRVLEDYEVKGKLASSTDSHRRALSVESTVEIIDPLETRYSNQDEWEVREGLVLDNGRQLKPDELVEEFLDESVQYEGEDQMWAHQQQTAAPLRDSIPESDDDASSLGFFRTEGDSDISPDDAVLRDMILYNVDEFLGSTLDDLESHIIQLRFGLNLDEPKSHKEIAFDLGITVNKVRKIQKEALEKLRNAYSKEYADDKDNQHNHEDTV